MKKAIVIYDTNFGNTARIAKALGKGMERGNLKVDCIQLDEIDIEWSDSHIQKVVIKCNNDSVCRIKLCKPFIKTMEICNNNDSIPYKKTENDILIFKTKSGQIYELNAI